MKKDFNYFVGEIENGKLVYTTAIGIRYESDAKTVSKWLNLVDGVAVEMTQADYEAVYNEKIKPVASTVNASNFAKYTLNNAGLTLVNIPVTEE